jgi:hemerythrin-like domain-containing protein
MMPIGPLMIEHRLIERMIEIMKRELQRIEREKEVDSLLIDLFVDFIQTYADRCHHGKEEDILFRDLKKKSLTKEHKQIMDELVDEHQRGRRITGQLIKNNSQYQKGDQEAINEIAKCLQSLVDFYPKHIEKEDKHFFIPIMQYFSQNEKDAMLHEGYEFDKQLIHEKYESIVIQTEERKDL